MRDEIIPHGDGNGFSGNVQTPSTNDKVFSGTTFTTFTTPSYISEAKLWEEIGNGEKVYEQEIPEWDRHKMLERSQAAPVPWRADKNPSLKFNERDGKIWWADHPQNDSGHCIHLIQRKHNLDKPEALERIADMYGCKEEVTVYPQPKEEPHPGYGPDGKELVKPGLWDYYLRNLNNGGIHRFATEKLAIPEDHLRRWNVGADKKGLTTFGYQNRDGQKITIKKIVYRNDGTKDKSREPHDFYYEKGHGSTLYGLHQVDPKKPYVVVEGEFDAVMASYHYPGYNWLATGGNNKAPIAQIRELCRTLDNGTLPTVIYLAENDKAGRENKVTKELRAQQARNPYVAVCEPFREYRPKYDIGNALKEKAINVTGDLVEDLKLKVHQILPETAILRKLLNRLSTVNFHKEGKLGEKEQVKHHHQKVLVVEKLLEKAKEESWNLCCKYDRVYMFNGAYWQCLEDVAFKMFLSEAAMKMGVRKIDAINATFVEAIYKQFMTRANLPEPDFETDTIAINLQNGTLRIDQTGKPRLDQFDPVDFLTYQLPFSYDPEADCPMFRAYLDKVIPEADKQKVVAEFLGYVFTRNLKLEKVMVLHGSGGNGKSVLYDIVTELLGAHNICHYSFSDVAASERSADYHRAEMIGKLLNYSSESGRTLDPEAFKKLASGEAITARHPYGRSFLLGFSDLPKFMINANRLFEEIELTDAFFRRLLIVPFERTISDKDKDPKLAQKIAATELAGVFNWILDGLKRLQTQCDFSKCVSSEKAVSAYQVASDSVLYFIEEEGYQQHDRWTKLKPVYDAYKSFCIENGMKPVSARKFAERLRAARFVIEKKNVGKVVYLQKAPPEAEDEEAPF